MSWLSETSEVFKVNDEPKELIPSSERRVNRKTVRLFSIESLNSLPEHTIQQIYKQNLIIAERNVNKINDDL